MFVVIRELVLSRAARFIAYSLAVCSVQFTIDSSAAERKILLRNETIDTSGPKRQGMRAASATPASGLYLLQLNSTDLPADWRDQLTALNVTVTRPVPQDAFVVDLNETNLGALEALPFVHWIGQYRPEHKTHVNLQALAQQAEDRRVRVSALLSPQANLRETALLQRRFSHLSRYSKTAAGRILEGEISSRQIKALMDSKAVLWLEPAAKPKLLDALAGRIVGGEGVETGLAIHDLGFDGEGVTVAVVDTGLNLGEGEPMHPDLEGRVSSFFYYGNLLDAADEHSHGTHVTGIIAGDGAAGETDENGFLYGLGIAPKASIVAQRVFDSAGLWEAPSMATLTRDAVRADAEIGSNSWGEDQEPNYSLYAMEFDSLVRDADPETPGDQPFILVVAAGNSGPKERSITSPALAKNVIAVGASQNERYDFLLYAGQEGIVDFSSRGPTEDGRIKPDISAPGTWIASLQSAGASDENSWMPISPLYQYQGGTSHACPQVSGGAAVFLQYYRETHNGATPSPALVKAALINSAVDMDNSLSPSEGGTTFTPNMDEGWGRMDLTELIGSDRTFDFTDQTTLLRHQQTFEKSLVLASGDLPLKITLGYTDVPGFPGAFSALVNDLDLEVISPSGVIFRGNQFIDSESVPNAPSGDSINNVEAVHIESPEAGEYIVRVIGRKVIADSRADTQGVIDQDFALVASAHIPFPGQAVVSLDRRAYTIPGQITVKLIDFDLAGQPTASVALASDSQTIPLNLSLSPSGNIGVFTGSVQTASIPFSNDGRLHFAHGDRITATYVNSPGELVVAEAIGDLVRPQITNVRATNRFGKELVTWRTDEPATSVVRYGTNINSPASVTNSFFRTEHEATLENLVAGQTYRYYVVSTDRAGNVSTNNNNGAYFSFIARSASPVLLVDAYTYTPGEERDDIEIAVTEYTTALDRTGVEYEVWDTETEGSPTVEDLRPFRVVIWRVNDSFYESHNTLSQSQQTAITEYLAGGGSFLAASMELLTRIGDTPFRTNVLQVAEFKQNPDPFSECPDCDEDYGAESIEGADLDSFTSGILTELDYSNYPRYDFGGIIPDIGPDISDAFVPTTNAVPIFFEPTGRIVGLRSPKTGEDSNGRVVYLSFPLDGVPLDAPTPNNRANLLRNLLAFLAPGINGFGTLSLDNTTYTAPSRMTIEVADSDLNPMASVSVTCRNVTAGTQTIVQLQPTVRRGVFRGFLALVPVDQPAGPERLRVADGDLIQAEYLDASGNAVVRATADVDLGLPAITNVLIEPEYENALITWETDELTDALVQFGESTFLGKTAYKSEMDISHSVLLTALLPDRIYYYRVVSRDTAGNTVVDDNNGALYSFRTLKPKVAPWRDNLENGDSDWSIQDGEDTEKSWTLGTPNNSLDTAAHSPPSAWGTNLDDEPVGYMFSNLISPAVELLNGNLATLSFWHNYDFTGEALIEYGRVLLFTNTQTQPIVLKEFADFSFGWEHEEFDLTPYLGRIVHIVWQYEMFDFSLESAVFPGWMIDDVEIAITNVARGVIEITNSTGAASFTVAGPTSFNGSGRSMVRSNALTGEYVVTFSPVPYFETPAPQTQTLNASGRLLFHGNYAFADANNNRMPDTWEQEQFGEVSGARTATTDTDSDGMTDLAEFVSGMNPSDPSSRLQLTSVEILPDNRVTVTWPAAEGKVYQLFGSSDARTWQPYSAPIRASAGEISHTFTAPTASNFCLFRIEAIP